MIKELRETIYDILNGVSGMSGKVFYKEAVQNDKLNTNVSLPYIVFSEVSSNYARLDTTTKTETTPVQVDVFSASFTESAHETLLELVKTALDNKSSYSLASYTVMDVLRDFMFPVLQEEVIQTSLQYTFKLIED